MYETQAVYSFSWAYYLTFIFFTAFAFLNMVIGIVVNVLEEERQKLAANDATEQHHQELEELQAIRKEMAELKSMLQSQAR